MLVSWSALPEINGVIARGGILVAKNFDAQEADDGGDAIAIEFQLLKILVAHCVARSISQPLMQIVEQFKAQSENFRMTGCNSRLTGNCGGLVFAGAFDVGAPGGKLFAAFFHRDGIFVGDIIHFAAEGVERGHGVAFWLRQQDEGEREVGRAFSGDGAAVLHHGDGVGGSGGCFLFTAGGRQSAGVRSSECGSCPAVALHERLTAAFFVVPGSRA